MKHTSPPPPWGSTSLTDSVMRDVHIAYKCDALEDHESLEEVQSLVDSAIERILSKTRRAISDTGPIRICVEHCRKGRSSDVLSGDLRYLKVYVEGHGPCIVMAY